MRISDWSSDVCSSDLLGEAEYQVHARRRDAQARGEGRTAVAGADARRALGRGDGRRGARGARAGVRARGKRLGPARMTTTFDPAAEPYEESRRLTGCNFYFSGTGAALEAAPGLSFDDAALARWRDNIDLAREALGWPDGEAVMRRHRSGVSLAFAAPLDCLYAATEVNEWAWWAAVASFSPGRRCPKGG